MDATKFVLDTRLELLDYSNDYGAYAAKLSTRLASTKKRLGVQDKHAAKHHSQLEVGPAQVAQNNECVPLPHALTSSGCVRTMRLTQGLG